MMIPLFLPLSSADNPFICNCELDWLSSWITKEGSSIVNLPKKTKCKLNPIDAVQSLEQINQISLITALESLSKRKNRTSTNDVQQRERDIKIKMDGKKNESLEMPDKKEIPVAEMNQCSASNRINYRYHLYCLVLSLILVHLIYRYLDFLFP